MEITEPDLPPPCDNANIGETGRRWGGSDICFLWSCVSVYRLFLMLTVSYFSPSAAVEGWLESVVCTNTRHRERSGVAPEIGGRRVGKHAASSHSAFCLDCVFDLTFSGWFVNNIHRSKNSCIIRSGIFWCILKCLINIFALLLENKSFQLCFFDMTECNKHTRSKHTCSTGDYRNMFMSLSIFCLYVRIHVCFFVGVYIYVFYVYLCIVSFL